MLWSFAMSSSVHGRLIVGTRNPHRERQLDIAVPAFVAIGEILQEERDISRLQIAAPAQLVGDVFRDVLRPALGSVKGDHADRVFVLPGQQISDDSLKVGPFVIGLALDCAKAAEVVFHQVDHLILAIGHDRRYPARITH
jgi:hypothetical protein